MGHISIKKHIEAPIERVFEFAADSRRTPEWASWITEAEAEPLATVGQRFKAKGQLLGRTMDVEGELTEFEPMRLVTLAGTTSLGSTWTWRTQFAPSGKGTDLSVEYEYDVPGLLGIFDKLVIERTVDRNFHNACETFADLIQAEVLQPA